MKTLIVVSGGDAPGINAAVMHYVALARRHGDAVVGASGGFAGVLDGQIAPVDVRVARLMSGHGGSLLASSRAPVLGEVDAEARLKAVLSREGIDNVLLFGGDGTLRHVLPLLTDWGVPVIALPTSIDNDVAGTERTLGFDSACQFAYAAIEGILATAHALPGRIFMVETLGGDAGFLALDIGYASGAHVVLLPEYTFELEWLAERLKAAVAADGYALAVLSEGVKTIPQFEAEIPRLTGIRLRYTKLGHAQRGGMASHIDRRLAADMSRQAYDALRHGVSAGVIVVRDHQVQLHQGVLSTAHRSLPDRALYDFVNGLG